MLSGLHVVQSRCTGGCYVPDRLTVEEFTQVGKGTGSSASPECSKISAQFLKLVHAPLECLTLLKPSL